VGRWSNKGSARVWLLVVVTMLMMCMVAGTGIAYAEGYPYTYEDEQYQDESPYEGGGITQSADMPIDNSKKVIKDISSAADMSKYTNEEAKGVAEGIAKIVSVVVQILLYFIIFGLALRIVLDLMYIGLPFSRSVLGGGRTGTPQTSPGGMGQPGFGGSRFGGFGGGGFGGFGGGGFGGFGGGFRGQGTAEGAGIQWISNAALNAVASENAGGPAVSPFKVYIKDMLAVLIITPILLTLALTGVLTQVGFLLGDLLVNAIRGFGGTIG
jgi:hypothetical protein